MADTLPDVTVPSNDFIDAYAATGITLGTSIVITNKSGRTILVVEAASKPAADSKDGVPIYPNNSFTNPSVVTGTPSGVWIKTLSPLGYASKVNIQEYVTS